MPDFIPPTVSVPLGTGRLFSRFLVAEPMSLIRDADGVWSAVREPTVYLLDAASAFYIGGYQNNITDEHMAEMKAQNLPGSWYWRAYGEGPYGGGDYGG